MGNTSDRDHKVSDSEYISTNSIKEMPPSSDDVRLAVKSILFENIDSESAVSEFMSCARDVMRPDRVPDVIPDDFVFLPMQNLIKPFRDLGYDIAPFIRGDSLGILESIREEIGNIAEFPEPKPSGCPVEIDGRYGVVFSREWLKSAQISDQPSKPPGHWEQAVSNKPLSRQGENAVASKR